MPTVGSMEVRFLVSEVPLYVTFEAERSLRPGWLVRPNRLCDRFPIAMLGVWHRYVTFEAEEGLRPGWCAQID